MLRLLNTRPFVLRSSHCLPLFYSASHANSQHSPTYILRCLKQITLPPPPLLARDIQFNISSYANPPPPPYPLPIQTHTVYHIIPSHPPSPFLARDIQFTISSYANPPLPPSQSNTYSIPYHPKPSPLPLPSQRHTIHHIIPTHPPPLPNQKHNTPYYPMQSAN